MNTYMSCFVRVLHIKILQNVQYIREHVARCRVIQLVLYIIELLSDVGLSIGSVHSKIEAIKNRKVGNL